MWEFFIRIIASRVNRTKSEISIILTCYDYLFSLSYLKKITWQIHKLTPGGARGVTDIVEGNGDDDPVSSLGYGCLHFPQH